jgi:hypothetical protein
MEPFGSCNDVEGMKFLPRDSISQRGRNYVDSVHNYHRSSEDADITNRGAVLRVRLIWAEFLDHIVEPLSASNAYTELWRVTT